MRTIAPTSTALPWGTVTLLAMTAFSSSGMMRMLDPMLPRLALEYGVPIGRAAWTITGFAVAYGLLQAFFGPLGDRLGKLRVIAGTAAIAVLACLACVLASGSFTGLIVARVIAGACCAAVIPLSMAWIGDAVPYEGRQTVLARFMIGQMTGMASGQTIGGFAAEHSFWQWPFIFFSAVFALAALLLWRSLAQAEATHTRSPALAGNTAQALLEVLRRPWVRVVLLVVLLEAIFFLGAFTFIATHLHLAGGMSLKAAGLTLIAFSAGGVGFALIISRYSGRIGEVRMAALGTLLSALPLIALALWPQASVAVAAAFVSGVGFYMLHNTLQTNATQMAPDRRGAAVALFATSFFLGQAIGVAIFGAVNDRSGTLPALLIGAVGLLPVGWWFAWALRVRRDTLSRLSA